MADAFGIVCSCSLARPAKEMLAESWQPGPEEADEQAKPAPAFNPAAAEYNELRRRLARSPALQQWQQLGQRVKQLESEMAGLKGAEKERKASELEEANEKLAAAEERLGEVKASFEADPLALVPWMQALFALADAGMTAFDTGSFAAGSDAAGGLEALLAGPSCSGALAAAERVLGAFKRRYDLERGPGGVQVIATLAPNIFSPGFSSGALVAELERARANICGAESADALGLVLLQWLDYEAADVVPHLRALQELSEDRVEASPETSEPAVSEPRRLRALGLVDPPAGVVRAALRGGVRLAAVKVSYSAGDVGAAEVVALCAQQGIRVLASGALLEGLVADAWLGAPCPGAVCCALDPAASLSSPAAAQRLVEAYGGWGRVQALLAALAAVAERRGVSMQAVALRWQADKGCVPVLPVWWGAGGPWRSLGRPHAGADEAPAGLVAQLLAGAGASFLTEEDHRALALAA